MNSTTLLRIKLAMICGIVVLFSGCSSTLPAESFSKGEVVGSWTRSPGQFKEINLNLNSDGSVVFWPVDGSSDKNVAEHGTYRLETRKVQLQTGSSIKVTFLHHDLKKLVPGIFPDYFRVNLVAPDRLELILVNSEIIDLERSARALKPPVE